MSRPDNSYAKNSIARRLYNGSKEVLRAAKRILGYIRRTSSLGLEIRQWPKEKPWILEVFSDSCFADNPSRKYCSTAGYLIFLNDTPVSWKTKRLKCVCTSSSQAEYLALYHAIKGTIMLGHIIKEFFGEKVFPVAVHCDKQ